MIGRTAVLLMATLLATPAFAGKRKPNPDFVEDALAYVLTDRTKSVELLEDAIEHGDGVSPGEIPVVKLHAGEQRRLLGEYDQATEWFEQVIDRGGRGWPIESARLGMLLVAAADGVDNDLLVALEDVNDKFVLETQNADRYLVLAVAAARVNDAPMVREYSRKSLQHSREDPEVYERVRARLEELTESTEEPESGEPEPVVEGPKPAIEVLSDLEKAERALQAGKPDRVRALVERIKAGEPSDEDALVADYLLKRLDSAALHADRVGVLLPLSGRYESAGRHVREAIEYGHAAGGGHGTLVFEDSGASAETAVAALEKLVLEEGVVAVLGPLLTDETEAVVSAAQAMRVPLIGLSQALEPADGQDWVFQSMVTPRDQVVRLLDHTMGELEMDAFAVFAPDNRYGHTAAEVFTEVVAQRGGKVTVTTFYDPAATDLIPFAKELGRKDYESRAWEFRKLKLEAEEKGGNPDRVVLPPTIDFDALFVPENASRVPIACAALAYEEFPIGQFQTSKKGPTIPMLGLSGWNNGALVTAGGPYVQGSLFTDSWFPDDEASSGFSDGYSSEVGRTPTPLEAVAADAGRVVAAAVEQRSDSRAQFREALLRVQLDGAATGATTIDPETRSVQRRIRILTIAEDAIEAVPEPEPAPETAAGTEDPE